MQENREMNVCEVQHVNPLYSQNLQVKTGHWRFVRSPSGGPGPWRSSVVCLSTRMTCYLLLLESLLQPMCVGHVSFHLNFCSPSFFQYYLFQFLFSLSFYFLIYYLYFYYFYYFLFLSLFIYFFSFFLFLFLYFFLILFENLNPKIKYFYFIIFHQNEIGCWHYYVLVIVDDFPRLTWTLFIVTMDDAFSAFKKLTKVIKNEKNFTIIAIKTNHGGEFQNEMFKRFCEKFGIKHNFSAPRTQ